MCRSAPFSAAALIPGVVAALMARHLSSPVKTFTIGFNEDAFNEIPDARRIAEHIGAEHHELVVTPDAIGMVEDLAWYCDEPSAMPRRSRPLSSRGWQWRHVKMVLSGDGGDEALPATSATGNTAASGKWPACPSAWPVRRFHSPVLRQAEVWESGYSALPNRMAPALSRTLLVRRRPEHRGRRQPTAVADVAGLDPYARIRDHSGVPISMRKWSEFFPATWTLTWLMTSSSRWTRMTMANSLRPERPIGPCLLEFLRTVAVPTQKNNGRVGKYLLKKVAADLLPAECLQKRKQGFGFPLAKMVPR